MAVVAAAAAVATVMAFAPSGSAAAGGVDLSKEDRARLADAWTGKHATVTVLVGAKSGSAKALASGLADLGADVRYRDDDLGYLRAVIATDRAEQVGELAGVQSVEIDAAIALPDPRPDAGESPAPQPAPGAGTAADNPYMPIGDTKAAQFVAAHPSYDGRGVTVGVIDTGIDLMHPALATTTTGERKIVEWVTGTHPTDDDDPTWVDMATNVSGPTFSVAGTTYTAPGAGTYRFGVFDERDPRLDGELGRDVNRDGNPAGSSGQFGVLWDGADTVWVDVDQDGSFADQAAMRNYSTNFDIGRFGTDNPATPVIEQIPFVVQVDGKTKHVNIGVVSGAHGTHVAGIIAGNGLFGGAMTGAAPGAKLVSVRACMFVAGCTSHALVEGMIFAVKQRNVDVINMSIGGLPALNDGNNTRALLYSRLIEQYNVQMFISAGNSGPGMNTIGDPSVAEKVLSVGTYVSKATWAANYGSVAPNVDGQNYFSSKGPREDGGFKPSIIAPGAAISSTPQWQPGGPVPGTYALPPGYSMFNGTSMAAPQAAGAGALLVSAAKQEDFQHQPAQIRQAVMSSARFVDTLQAFEQGAGLLDVNAAYEKLRTNIKTVDITSQVPVSTALSQFLATPNVGAGIHDREGVTHGQAYTRTYTFTRTSGGGGVKTYQLSWVGNDGTFSLPAGTVSLGLNSPATVTVGISPSQYGAHSAILWLDDPDTVGIDLQTLNTVVVPYTFGAADNFEVEVSGEVGRNSALHYFFQVPPGTPAFKVDFSGPDGTPGTGQARFVRYHPFGLGVDSNGASNCYSPSVAGCSTGSPNSRSLSNPAGGVWEVSVDARRTSDALFTPFQLKASILGAGVLPSPDVIASATAGVPIARSYTLTSTLGAFEGRAVGAPLGSARRGPFTIANHQVQQYAVTVTPGSTSLRATIGGTSDPSADLDLYLFNCTSGSCVRAALSADGDSEESVSVSNPAAGTWVVLIDGFSVPAGSTSYEYLDVFANAAFGTVSVTDANALRPTGASWTVPGSVTAGAAPAAGRVLLGAVEVRTSAGVLVGRGDVIVQNVG